MLRDYQKQLITNTRRQLRKGNNRVLCVLPTGAGKTFTFCNILRSAIDKGSNCLILTDRIELLTQANGALSNFNLDAELIEAGRFPELTSSLHVAMVETLNRRVNRLDYIHYLNQLDLIIIDEAHIRNFTKIFEHLQPKTTVLGFTATPERQGRKRLLKDEYQKLVVGVEISYLISKGFLATPHYFGIKADLSGIGSKMGDYDQDAVADKFSEDKIYVGVLENYKKHTEGKKAIVFSSNIASSQEICKEFISKGYDAKHLDSNSSDTERKSILEWYKHSPNGILCNVGILTRGFDQPDIEVVILYRATKSLPLYLQMVGRGSRVTDVKKDFYILDFGNNVYNHKYWHIERQWTLEPPRKRKKSDKQEEPSIKECPNCCAIIPIQVRFCTECNFEFVPSEKERVFAELQKLNYEEIKAEVSQGISFERLLQIQEAKGYKVTWVWRQVPSDRLQEFAKYMSYSNGWVTRQLKMREQW